MDPAGINNMVDVIVATGATISSTWISSGGPRPASTIRRSRSPDDDNAALLLYIDRIYDTYIDEEQLQDSHRHDQQDRGIARAQALFVARAFIREMGKISVEHGKKDNSLVKLPLYEPIFCLAFVDLLSAGFGLVKHHCVDAAKQRPYDGAR